MSRSSSSNAARGRDQRYAPGGRQRDCRHDGHNAGGDSADSRNGGDGRQSDGRQSSGRNQPAGGQHSPA